MLRRSFRIGVLFGIAAGVVAAVVKAVQSRSASQPLPATDWVPLPNTEPVVVPPRPAPAAPTPPEAVADDDTTTVIEAPAPVTPAAAPPAPKPAARKAPAKKAAPKPKPEPTPEPEPEPWVEPVDGACPASHPVKAKLASKIFHLPGGLNYARTAPDRCYIDAAAAEADGLRQAKR